MEQLSLTYYKQIFLSDIWKQLDYQTLIKYCQTSKKYLPICLDPETWIYLLKRDFNVTWNVTSKSPRDYYELHYSYFIDGSFMQQLFRILKDLIKNSSQKPVTWFFASDYDNTLRNAEITVVNGVNDYEILDKILRNKLIPEIEILESISYYLPLNIGIDLEREIDKANKGIIKPLTIASLTTPFFQPTEFIATLITSDISEVHNYSERPYSSGECKSTSFVELIDSIIESISYYEHINIGENVRIL